MTTDRPQPERGTLIEIYRRMTLIKQNDDRFRSIIKSGNSNYSLVGLTPAKAKEVGVTGSIDNVPSIDPEISKCHKLSGGPRVSCWAALDKKLMEKVVPWVPYLSAANVDISGPKVAQWEYDQFADGPAYAHVALK